MMVCYSFRCLAMIIFITGSNAVLWSSSPDNITACDGHNVTIPWSFTLSSTETVISTTWFVERNDGVRTLFASLTEGEFFPHSRQHVQFVPNAGLRLQYVTVNDTGLYSVHVSSVDRAGHVTISNHSVAVQVTAPPVLSGGQLIARRRSAPEKDDVTGGWHVILECGQFIDRGQPPVTVQWRTPSGAVYTNVNYREGYFYLPLQAVELGNYTCSLSYQSVAKECLSMLLGEVAVDVDENVKWTVMEANQRELIAGAQILRQENQELKSQVQIMRQENQELKSQVQIMRQENQELKSQVQILRQEDQELKSQVQNLTHNLEIVHQEDEKLKSQDQNLTHRINQLEKQLINEGTCMDIRNRSHWSGVYTLYQGNSTITVYCDQVTDGGGWTVFQRRQDGSVNFFRNWANYRNGFGDLNGEFWLGLDNLHILTSLTQYEMRVDLEMFNGSRAFAHYRGFRIGDVNTDYTLYYDNFLDGNAGDSLTTGTRFSTQDHGASIECAGVYQGGWWYHWNLFSCYSCDLNGIYRPAAQTSNGDDIHWPSFTGYHISLKRTEMKIRPM